MTQVTQVASGELWALLNPTIDVAIALVCGTFDLP